MIKVLNMNTKNLKFIYFFQIVRPYQWVKNILVFIPMLMSHQLTINNFIISIKAFIIFSLVASTIYIINDIAISFGGGGHKLAAGATVNNLDATDIEQKILNKLKGKINVN